MAAMLEMRVRDPDKVEVKKVEKKPSPPHFFGTLRAGYLENGFIK
jgi:hypothetical protein